MPVVHIRRATLADITVIAQHRANMFSDMGQLPEALGRELIEQTVEYLGRAIPEREYCGWLAAAPGAPEIVGGAGVQLRRTLPHPLTHEGTPRIASGRQAIVLNVYTQREWRGQGVATLLMAHIIDWAKAAGIDTLVLHASNDGRRLYERLGFMPTSEMRFTGSLRRG